MAADNQEQPESQLSIQKDAPITVTGEVEKEKPTGWQRWMWILIAIVSFVYIFIPEPTDAIPILGWLDEGLAAIIFSYALERLGVRIPLVQRILGTKAKKKK